MAPRAIVALFFALLTGCATVARAEGPAPTRFAEHVIAVGDVMPDDIAPAQKKFDERIAAGDKLITLRINSYGGSVAAGMDFIQHIEDAKKESHARVQCVVDEKAMSMGFIILQSTACDDRLMTKRSQLLAHRASGRVEGNEDNLEEALRHLRAVDDAMAEIAAARLKISVRQYKAKVANGDWVFACDEALRVGAVDGFVEPMDIPSPYKLDAPDAADELFKRIFGG